MLSAPLPKKSKINTPLIKSTPFPIKIENPIVQEVGDLMPLMDLSTSAFPPLASQQGVFDMDMESEIGNISNISSINTPQFSFDEDSRQISHQIMRVAANSTKDRQDCFRQLLFATVFAFESSPKCTNVEEFFRMMGERYAKKKKHASQTATSSRSTPRNLGLDENRTASTPKTKKKRSKTAPKKYRQEEEDLEAMDDDNDRSEEQPEIDSDFVVSMNQESENHGNSDEVIDLFESNEDETEEKPRLMLAAPLPKKSKIITSPFPIKIENPIVQAVGDLLPLMDLSTSAFPPTASQQGILDMDMDSLIGSVSNSSSINTPQFSFDEDIRQIAHQLSRVATARPECHDALREVLYGTIVEFGNGGFNGNVGEFYKKMNGRYNH
ncbi:hypothetical protein GCK72_007680 [Caenorhabditis remanei]|uniref:Uncharacterized protein n=1 Tax=Caenorhabditis remanei TaxID=31234 RepID=A0A6A5HKR5_CAERE|nr:hypothetical protein GCK72_007680 [Caenorhabditis remanei]KAF1767721.1 hypothetical protein GCK72_007680 [Caenorhabditis remanei]